MSDHTTEIDVCEHSKTWDEDCATCDDQETLYVSFGAMTPREHGIAHRAYRAGQASVIPPGSDPA